MILRMYCHWTNLQSPKTYKKTVGHCNKLPFHKRSMFCWLRTLSCGLIHDLSWTWYMTFCLRFWTIIFLSCTTIFTVLNFNSIFGTFFFFFSIFLCCIFQTRTFYFWNRNFLFFNKQFCYFILNYCRLAIIICYWFETAKPLVRVRRFLCKCVQKFSRNVRTGACVHLF